MKTYARHKQPHSTRCWFCGDLFPAIRSTAFLCKPKCRQAWKRGLEKATKNGIRNPIEFVRNPLSIVPPNQIPISLKKTRSALAPKTTSDVAALTKTVQQNIEDQTAQLILCDALEESGLNRHQAENVVDLIVTEAIVSSHLNTIGRSRWRKRIRKLCGVLRGNVPVNIVSGDLADQPPRITGRAAYSTFRGTNEVCHASIATAEVDHHEDTRKIEVGIRWVRSTFESEVTPATPVERDGNESREPEK